MLRDSQPVYDISPVETFAAAGGLLLFLARMVHSAGFNIVWWLML